MKKLYAFILAASFTTAAFAQSAITACKKASGEISIVYDLSKNCTTLTAGTKDTLGKRTEIGFHSGANSFGAGLIREWNSAPGTGGVAVITAKRMAGTSGVTAKFHITIPNPVTYYSAGATALTNIKFVFNDGIQGLAATSNYPWYAEGKASNAAGTGCDDFEVVLGTLATCATGTNELQNVNVAVAPNPFKTATYIKFNNPSNKEFTLTLMDAVGRVARTYSNITSEVVEIQRGNLPSGMYFAVLKNTEGQSITQKLIAE
jgi:Secretion system C-terminal sorting domain